MRIKDVIHYILKLTKGIFKSKMYNIQFIMTKKNGKSSFVFILVFNLYLPKTRFHVEFSINYCTIKSFQ